ncbi:MAG: orotate phosphoribosyltransferase [Roseovarius sp.]|jgi:orotate phosphoribosyltransferase|nr:orotate phosphoribosyltransferase [Roseovarius sp.]
MSSVAAPGNTRPEDPQARRTRLKEIITQKSFSNEREVTLSSGRTSFLYFNMKPTMLDNEAAYLIAREVLSLLPAETDMVGGLEMGAVPLVSALCPVAHVEGRKVQAFFIRKKKKDYGAQKLVEGLADGVSLRGKNVVVVDDVTTTGASVASTLEILRDQGANILMVLSIVDREEGASERFDAERIRFVSLFKASEFS